MGIVGTGFGQQVLLPAFQANPYCEVHGIAASTRENAETVAQKYHIRAYDSWEAAASDPETTVLAIAVPPHQQAQIAIRALQNGKAVFCEKPLGVSTQDAQHILTAARQHNCIGMVDFEFPVIDVWMQTKSILDSGEIGSLRHIAVNWNVETYANKHHLDSWKTQAESGGGALNMFVCHVFYYLEWFAGEITTLSTQLHRSPVDNRSADTTAVLTVEFASGVIASISVSTDAFMGSGHRVELYGDNGTLILENTTADYTSGFQLYYATRQSAEFAVIPTQYIRSAQDGRIGVISEMVNRFISWLRDGIPARPSLEDGLRVQYLMDTARISHMEQRRVDVSFSADDN